VLWRWLFHSLPATAELEVHGVGAVRAAASYGIKNAWNQKDFISDFCAGA
jgi:hypothetical protein